MCGIAGYVKLRGEWRSPAALLRMVMVMRRRGPDDEGMALIDPHHGASADLATDHSVGGVAPLPRADAGAEAAHQIGLGQCRFSIVDLSQGGHQPFWSADRGVCVVFNGEIYNYLELRAELEKLGHAFRTQSDTEVLVEAYRQWGTECFSRFVGFWAIALYDAKRQAVLLARDRLGKAPLYIARHDGAFWWASEINAIHAAVGRGAFPIREQAVADFMAFSWRDIDHQTFYDGIETFPNAAYAWVKEDGSYDPVCYWQLPQRRRTERQFPVAEAMEEFRRLLGSAVKLRLRADVPVGFELSGGVDSSTLVAAAAGQGCRIHAYTVSFPGTPADEEPYARQVYERYREQVEYSVLHLSAGDFWEQADEYVGHMAEPFHSPNVVANRDIWRQMAARGIRVSINGAAGDESWAGYFNDYYRPFLRHLAGRGQWGHLVQNCRLFGDAPHSLLSRTFWGRLVGAFMPEGRRNRGVYQSSSAGGRVYEIFPEWNPLTLGRAPRARAQVSLEQLLIDNMGSLRMNYWLRSGNQSFMSVPTEVRCPFLDHRLVELAFTVPVTYLIRDGWLKWLVRKAMADQLPPEVVWRKRKMGFPFPYEQWAVGSKSRFFGMLGSSQCPYVSTPRLREAYDVLARENPLFLWRLMSLSLWWKKCVLGESLI